jgi:hypothetical protein
MDRRLWALDGSHPRMTRSVDQRGLLGNDILLRMVLAFDRDLAGPFTMESIHYNNSIFEFLDF